jgi:dihydropteroate synthase
MKKPSKSFSSTTLRDQVRRLTRENERLINTVAELSLQEATAMAAAQYLFHVVSVHDLIEGRKASEQWPFLVDTEHSE